MAGCRITRSEIFTVTIPPCAGCKTFASLSHIRRKKMSLFQGLFGPPDVSKMKAKRDVKGLVNALSYDKDEAVRREARLALLEIGDPRAVEPLINLLKNSDVPGRKVAMELLGALGDARAVEPLIDALLDEHLNPIPEVVNALCKIGAAAVEPLVAALKSENKFIRQAAVDILDRLGDTRAVDPLFFVLKEDGYWVVRREAAKTLGKLGDARVVGPLFAAREDPDDATRLAAITALGVLGKPALDSLIVVVKEPQKYWDIKQQAIKALGMIGDPVVVELLLDVLRDHDQYIRAEAAAALGRVSRSLTEAGLRTRVVESLVAGLRDTQAPVRAESANALGGLGNSAALTPLTITYVYDDVGYVSMDAANAISKLGAPDIEILQKALRDERKHVRSRAVQSLEKQLRWQPVNDETRAAYWVEKREWEKCEAIGAPSVPALILTLKDSDEFVRIMAAGILGRLKDGRAVEPLIAELEGDLNMGGAAARALGKIGDARAVEPLIHKLMHGSAQDDAAVALVSLYHSGQMDDYHKSLILSRRGKINRNNHHDFHDDGDCPKGHTDYGVNISF
jgi:HEAT repeat protein